VEGIVEIALARNILSCLKSLTHCAVGVAKRPARTMVIDSTRTGPAASADPSAVAIGRAKRIVAPATARLVISETETMVGASRSISRSARARHDETPNSPIAETIMKTVEATAKIPKAWAFMMRAMIAITPMLENRRSIVAAMFQRAFRRTLVASVPGRCAVCVRRAAADRAPIGLIRGVFRVFDAAVMARTVGDVQDIAAARSGDRARGKHQSMIAVGFPARLVPRQDTCTACSPLRSAAPFRPPSGGITSEGDSRVRSPYRAEASPMPLDRGTYFQYHILHF
jgi:hypothetical protein